jgi:hypothetical protein
VGAAFIALLATSLLDSGPDPHRDRGRWQVGIVDLDGSRACFLDRVTFVASAARQTQ